MWMKMFKELGAKGMLETAALVLLVEMIAMGLISYMSLIIISGIEEMFVAMPTWVEIVLWCAFMGIKRTVLDFIAVEITGLIEER